MTAGGARALTFHCLAIRINSQSASHSISSVSRQTVSLHSKSFDSAHTENMLEKRRYRRGGSNKVSPLHFQPFRRVPITDFRVHPAGNEKAGDSGQER